MKIGITGSRSCEDRKLVFNALAKHKPSAIIAGGAKGADSLAKQYAINNGIEYIEKLPRFKTDQSTPYHPRWYMERNKEIVASCDLLLAFWDGKSKGTANTIKTGRKQNKEIIIIDL